MQFNGTIALAAIQHCTASKSIGSSFTDFVLQAGAAAVASDSTDTGSGSSTPTASTAPTGPTPMDSDQTILNSALGTSRATNSDSAPQGSAAANQANGLKAESDSVMEEASTIAQNALQNGDASRQEDSEVTGPSGANEPGVTGPSRLGSDHEEEVAQLGFAVQFVVQGLRNGAGPSLMPLLVRLLPYLLKTQVSLQNISFV